MTAKEDSPQDGESVTTAQVDEQISQGDEWTRADYSPTEAAGPVVEMMSIPTSAQIKIEGHRAEDTDERSVQMDIITPTSEPNATIKQILTPEQAKRIGKQLIAAARVADDTE